MTLNTDVANALLSSQWDAILRAPITGTECAFVDDPVTSEGRIVVIYNASDTPPVVTVDVNDDTSLATLKADGAPIAVMSCQSNQVPDVEDVMLVARYVPYSS